MGLCGSKSQVDEAKLREEKRRSRELEKAMNKDHQLDQQINKLLLLGAGESGKSTLFKQMISIYGKGFSDEDRREYTHIVYTNVIGSIKTLCEQSEELSQKGISNTRVASKNFASKQFVEELKETAVIDSKAAAHFAALWADPGIQVTYEHRSMYQLTDSTGYFLDKIHEVGNEDYLPTEQDVLRSRVRTTGIVENDFVIDGNQFKMFDVGGQRNERKKWIHCFSDVTAVLFVAALSEYDMVLYEDEDTNRMEEALNLFDEICNSRWFKKTSMILMLNKRDLFAEKIQKVPLSKCFPDYTGANTYESATRFIQEQFEMRNRNPDKQIYSHITCATDKNNMKVVFNAVKDIVIRRSLQEGGLLS
jgi:guanine nucleotide-binding protein G(o) subunit alpha